MKLERGDQWQIFNQTDLFCITTNSTIRNDGCLVMGRGIALQAKNKLPGIDRYLGQLINGLYGLITIDHFKPQKIGAFQVKFHYRDKAQIELIRYSTSRLQRYIDTYNLARVDLNYPGMGYGHLSESEVMPVIAILPDCVHIWRLE